MMNTKIYILIFPLVLLGFIFSSQVSKSTDQKLAFEFKSQALREKHRIERKELGATRIKELDVIRKQQKEIREAGKKEAQSTRQEARKKSKEERVKHRQERRELRENQLKERNVLREKRKKEKEELREKQKQETGGVVKSTETLWEKIKTRQKMAKERKEARKKSLQERNELRKKQKEEAKQEILKRKSDEVQKEDIEKKTENKQEDYEKIAARQIKEREEHLKKAKKSKRFVEVVSNPEDPLAIQEAAVIDSKTSFLKIDDVELGYKIKLKNQTPKIINNVLLIWVRKIPFNDSLTISREIKVSKPIIPYEEREIQYNDLDTKREGEIYKVKVDRIVFEDGSQWQNPVKFHHHY